MRFTIDEILCCVGVAVALTVIAYPWVGDTGPCAPGCRPPLHNPTGTQCYCEDEP